MLDIKPNCECCDKDLAANSDEAMICSYECTFCRRCVDEILENVCPNCGGGFMPRPVRPQKAYRADHGLAYHPAATARTHCVYSIEELKTFSADIKLVDPYLR